MNAAEIDSFEKRLARMQEAYEERVQPGAGVMAAKTHRDAERRVLYVMYQQGQDIVGALREAEKGRDKHAYSGAALGVLINGLSDMPSKIEFPSSWAEGLLLEAEAAGVLARGGS